MASAAAADDDDDWTTKLPSAPVARQPTTYSTATMRPRSPSTSGDRPPKRQKLEFKVGVYAEPEPEPAVPYDEDEYMTVFTGTNSSTLTGMERYSAVTGRPPSLVPTEELLANRLAPRAGTLVAFGQDGINVRAISTTTDSQISVYFIGESRQKPFDPDRDIEAFIGAGDCESNCDRVRVLETVLLRLARFVPRAEIDRRFAAHVEKVLKPGFATLKRRLGDVRTFTDALLRAKERLSARLNVDYSVDLLKYVGSAFNAASSRGDMPACIAPDDVSVAPFKIGDLISVITAVDHDATPPLCTVTHGIVTEFDSDFWVVAKISQGDTRDSVKLKQRNAKIPCLDRPSIDSLATDTSSLRNYVNRAISVNVRLLKLIQDLLDGNTLEFFAESEFEKNPFGIIFECRVPRRRCKILKDTDFREHELDRASLAGDIVRILVPEGRAGEVKAWLALQKSAFPEIGTVSVVVDERLSSRVDPECEDA